MAVSDNNRVFYACQAVAFDKMHSLNGSPSIAYLEGVQSVSLSSSADTEQVFQFGEIGIFENYATRTGGDGEITIEKFIAASGQGSIGAMLCASGDNQPLTSGCSYYLYASGIGSPTSTSEGFGAMAAKKLTVKVFILPETSTNFSGGSEAGKVITFNSGIVSEYSISAQIDGPATESVTFSCFNFGQDATSNAISAQNTGSEIAKFSSTGTVVKRGKISGTGSDADSISYSVSIGNEDLFNLGSLDPYARVPTFPASVTAEITEKADSAFNTQAGGNATSLSTSFGGLQVTVDQMVLTNTSFGGGDAAGGNATITKTYNGFNNFKIVWDPRYTLS